MKPPELARSYKLCESIARTQAANFYPAFRLLPGPQRLAMCALYAFLRITDDLSDEPAEPDVKQASLRQWRDQLTAAMDGEYLHPIYPALHHTVETYSIPLEYLTASIDGVEMDLADVRYETFAELENYCYHVASVVGLSCIHIWGFSGDGAREYAEKAGVALQLTNILRDLGEDAARGRVYLPADELAEFGYDPADLARGHRGPAFRALMQFQVARARRYYEQAWPLIALLRPAGRSVFLMMARTYSSLLDEIERCDYDVFSRRVRVAKWRKLYLALTALPARWGWPPGAPGPKTTTPSAT